MRGGKPKPTSLKILHGNPGKRPLNDREPEAKPEIPEPPDHMTERQREIWNRFGREMKAAGVLTKLDAVAYEMLCRAYVASVEAAEKVAEHGPVWMEKGDGKIPKFAYSPYWAVQNREEKKLLALLAEFGLTPSSRTRIKVDKEDKGKLAEFLG